MTDREIVNILVRLRDDFGFSALRLAHRLVESRYERPSEAFTVVPIPLPAGPATELLVPHRWALEGLNLVPEDVVSYYLEVADNDRVSGPKTARSPLYTLRLPSMEEVFAEADRGHETGLQSLQQALEQAQEARKEMEDLQKDLRQQKARLDWQEQKKAEQMFVERRTDGQSLLIIVSAESRGHHWRLTPGGAWHGRDWRSGRTTRGT